MKKYIYVAKYISLPRKQTQQAHGVELAPNEHGFNVARLNQRWFYAKATPCAIWDNYQLYPEKKLII